MLCSLRSCKRQAVPRSLDRLAIFCKPCQDAVNRGEVRDPYPPRSWPLFRQ